MIFIILDEELESLLGTDTAFTALWDLSRKKSTPNQIIRVGVNSHLITPNPNVYQIDNKQIFK